MPFTLLEVIFQASGPPPPITIFALGKSLFTVSFCALASLILGAKAVWRASRGGAEQTEAAGLTMNASLFWGAMAGLTGQFHTVMGLILVAASVSRSSPIEPEAHGLIAVGTAVALGASAYGMLVLLMSSLAWFGFRTWRLRTSSAAG